MASMRNCRCTQMITNFITSGTTRKPLHRNSRRVAANWYGSNLLAGNIKKYQAMNIGFSQSNGNIHVNGEEIKTTDNLQLLGVTLDSNLSFSNHINLSCKKASQRIGV